MSAFDLPFAAFSPQLSDCFDDAQHSSGRSSVRVRQHSTVERGLGLAILSTVEYDPLRDIGLALVKTPDLFPPSVTSVTIHHKHHLPLFAFDFIEMFAPRWTRARIEQLLATKKSRRAARST